MGEVCLLLNFSKLKWNFPTWSASQEKKGPLGSGEGGEAGEKEFTSNSMPLLYPGLNKESLHKNSFLYGPNSHTGRSCGLQGIKENVNILAASNCHEGMWKLSNRGDIKRKLFQSGKFLLLP